ncbi:MAG: FlgO family outer membrane protein [Pseudomonadota bacterium]
MNKYTLIIACILTLGLTGCAGDYPYRDARKDQFIPTNYKAADALIASAKSLPKVPNDAPILVAALVNIDTLNQSSSLGRIISEQIQARLSQMNYTVVELKLRGEVFTRKPQGELMLSREISEITAAHNAQAVVVGTYAVGSQFIYVNLKVVGKENLVLGAYDYTLPKTANTKALLNDQ